MFTKLRQRDRRTESWPVSRKRASTSGIVLIPTVIAALLIAGLLVTLQARFASQNIVSARMVRFYSEQASHAALYELSRVDIARGILSWRKSPPDVPLNSEVVEKELFGQPWTVRYQDVAGLIDLYTASPTLLAAVGIDADAVTVRRAEVLSDWPDGLRPATVDQSIALFGVDTAFNGVLTQESGTAGVDAATVSEGLVLILGDVGPFAQRAKQPEVVAVLVGTRH